MKFRVILVILFIILLTNSTASLALTILPEMELLAGVLSQTSWINMLGPQGAGNEYFQALQQFFEPYGDHPAIIQAQRFTDEGFFFDAPPAFICHLGPLPELKLAHEYSDYLIARAGNRQLLEDFRLALRDLANDSNFLEFFRTWEEQLEASLEKLRMEFRRDRMITWLEDFFGWSASEFYLLMAPSMFPGGGYGATVTDSDGNLLAFQIIREEGYSQKEPQFPSVTALEQLTIHELGHFFVNPSLGAYPRRARRLGRLFSPVSNVMAKQAYGNVTTFLNEQVIRAVEVIAAGELFNERIQGNILMQHESRGFYLTGFVVKELEYYQQNRDIYPTFREFVPYLYDRLQTLD